MGETVNTPQCEDCGADLTGRSDAVYCSGACRQRAYRARRRILDRYGSWEAALAASLESAESILGPRSVTDSGRDSRNGSSS